jgi:hypothetical protein
MSTPRFRTFQEELGWLTESCGDTIAAAGRVLRLGADHKAPEVVSCPGAMVIFDPRSTAEVLLDRLAVLRDACQASYETLVLALARDERDEEARAAGTYAEPETTYRDPFPTHPEGHVPLAPTVPVGAPDPEPYDDGSTRRYNVGDMARVPDPVVLP